MDPHTQAAYFQDEADYWASRARTAGTDCDRDLFEQASQFCQTRADYYRHQTTSTDVPSSRPPRRA